MNIGNEGLNLIKHFEGCELQAYKCPAGVWTIGYGHIKGVSEGMTITQEEREQFPASYPCNKWPNEDDLPQLKHFLFG